MEQTSRPNSFFESSFTIEVRDVCVRACVCVCVYEGDYLIVINQCNYSQGHNLRGNCGSRRRGGDDGRHRVSREEQMQRQTNRGTKKYGQNEF